MRNMPVTYAKRKSKYNVKSTAAKRNCTLASANEVVTLFDMK